MFVSPAAGVFFLVVQLVSISLRTGPRRPEILMDMEDAQLDAGMFLLQTAT